METDLLVLKFGSLKGYEIVSDDVWQALQQYISCPPTSRTILESRDTAKQKKLLCRVIDLIEQNGGQIKLSWDDKIVSAAEAKKYVMEYR